MNEEAKTKELKIFIEELKKAGFKVYAPEELTMYCNFVKGDSIGYVECDDFGFNFSTVHKPNRYTGTGFSIYKNIGSPTVKMAQDCFVIAPHWENSSSVKKYENWEDYANKNPLIGLRYVEV